MMTINPFNSAKNVEFSGNIYVKELDMELPCYTLTEPDIDKWNAMAKKFNTEAFIREFGRDPVDYNEVLNWVNSIIEKAKEKAVQAGTYTTL